MKNTKAKPNLEFTTANELVNELVVPEKKESKKFQLNKEQIDAINTVSGNLLILASAGTGKTTTIVERYVNLVENHNYNPNEILMTTFTNKAAKDMIRKIEGRTKKIPPWAGTMHSLFLRVLRENAHLIPISPDFTLITDDYDKKKIIKQILEKEGIETRNDNITYFLNRIGRFKNAGILAESLDENLNFNEAKGRTEELIEDELIHIQEEIKKYANKIYKKYQEFLRTNNLVDFDDILLFTYEILEKNEKIRKIYSNKFKVIMVDEAQDLNVVQIKILDLLENNNLCLIGDDCQNIYEWRGSSNELVFKFNKTHKQVILKDNYRSTKKIISVVNKAIDSLKFKINKKLSPTREEGNRIVIESFSHFENEIRYLSYEVKNLIKSGVKEEDIAVLFRTNNIGKQIEKEFRRNKIPCHLSRARSFFEREEVKDILSFLRLKINPYSFPDFERVINLIPGFGDSKIEKLREISISKKCSFVGSLDFSDELKLSEELNLELEKLKKSFKSEDNPVKVFLENSNYNKIISRKYYHDSERIKEKEENTDLMEELIEEYSFNIEGIRNFLDSLIDLEKREKDKDKVVLSTIHSAKGLEWKYVFLAGCNEKILPFYKDGLSTLKRDSELRLFYVAISRAKDFLIITHSEGNEWKDMAPSQFLDIIE